MVKGTLNIGEETYKYKIKIESCGINYHIINIYYKNIKNIFYRATKYDGYFMRQISAINELEYLESNGKLNEVLTKEILNDIKYKEKYNKWVL